VRTARAANDVLRFGLELAALAGLAVWGWRTGPTGVNVLLAIAAPAAATALWGAFVAPKARRHPPDPWRLLLELAVFCAGTAAWAGAGLGSVALVVGVLSVLHLAATFPLGQRLVPSSARN
jgi:Protein of unknown function (DUF2568)